MKKLDSVQVDELAIKFSETKDVETGRIILKAFEPYLQKYVRLLQGHLTKGDSADTQKFFRLFVKAADKNRFGGIENIGKALYTVQKAFKSFTKEDLYHELVSYFLESLSRYQPIKKYDKTIISFTHFVQVQVRFKIYGRIYKSNSDALGRANIEYEDITQSPSLVKRLDIELTPQWVDGSCEKPFSSLNQFERYLIYLRYGEGFKVCEIAEMCSCTERKILYRLAGIRKKLRGVNI